VSKHILTVAGGLRATRSPRFLRECEWGRSKLSLIRSFGSAARSSERSGAFRHLPISGNTNLRRFSMWITRGALALSSFLLASCSDHPPFAILKPSLAENSLTWHSIGAPVSLEHYLDDRNKCLRDSHFSAVDDAAESNARSTASFASCFRAAGYVPEQPSELLAP